MNLLDNIHLFLNDYGIWSLVILLAAKFILGILVAVQNSEFKFYYIGDFARKDLVKVLAVAAIALVLQDTALTAMIGGVIAADLTAGIMKNLAHMFPSIADKLPSSLREPARLRLGNSKNLQ